MAGQIICNRDSDDRWDESAMGHPLSVSGDGYDREEI